MTPLSKAADDYRRARDEAAELGFLIAAIGAFAILGVVGFIAADPMVQLILEARP